MCLAPRSPLLHPLSRMVKSLKEADGGCLVFRIEYPVCCGRLGGEEKPRVLSYRKGDQSTNAGCTVLKVNSYT